MASFAAHHHGALEMEGMVPSFLALKSRLRASEESADQVAAAYTAAACGVGAGSGLADVSPDDFSVEDLLDLDALCEVGKDCAVLGDDAAPEPLPGTAAVEDKVSGDPHVSSSMVSYELITPQVPPQMIDLPLPDHNVEDLEWVSRLTDDTIDEPPAKPKLPAASLPPVGSRPLVWAAAASCPALPVEATLVPVKAKRSSRSRAPVWSATPSSPTTITKTFWTNASAFWSPPMFRPGPASSPFSLYSSHYYLHDDAPRPSHKKDNQAGHGGKCGGEPKKLGGKPTKRHRRPTQYATALQQGDRRCRHCGLQKTPQWRAGPEGPKTLCNACGVRFKSGRLLPEYRPACSPTFVSTIHSNFHRKVMEMRRKNEDLHGPVPPAAHPGIGPSVSSFLPYKL